MDLNMISQAVQFIQNRILTPVIYMSETDYKIEFICFCSAEVSDEDLFEAGECLTKLLNRPTEVVDILEYNENDRMDIITSAVLVYSEDPIIEQMFTLSMAEEFKRVQEQKKSMLRRKSESGSYYLQ